MRAFTPLSTSSLESSKSIVEHGRVQADSLLWLFVVALLLAYVSPWLVGPGAALSFGGYDLAEWASLPPGVRSQSPPLIASFLLRFPLAAITLMLAFAAPYRRLSAGWLMVAAGMLILIAAQLPPPEFLTSARNDPNYGQQFTLALISLVGGVVGLAAAPAFWRSLFAAVWAAVGAVVSVAGVLSAHELIAAYGIQVRTGAAAYVFVGLFVAAALWSALVFIREIGYRNR